MDAPFLVRGDPLPELGPLTEVSCGTRPHGLLWGVDLTRCRTRKHARAVWHGAVDGVKTVLDAHPEVRRVCLACTRPRQFPHNALIRTPDGLALRLHNDLERDRGRYACVLVLDITGCDDPTVLHARLREALATPMKWADLTLTWNSIADTSVVDAWAGNTL